jgi:hypothetical protein
MLISAAEHSLTAHLSDTPDRADDKTYWQGVLPDEATQIGWCTMWRVGTGALPGAATGRAWRCSLVTPLCQVDGRHWTDLTSRVLDSRGLAYRQSAAIVTTHDGFWASKGQVGPT